MNCRARVCLIHATPLAIGPITTSFGKLWPEATLSNLLDDSLSRDLKQQGSIDAAMIERFKTLARYGWQTGAQGIMFTCSSFGPAIDACREALPVPVLKPNEAMIEEALQMGNTIALLASFEPAIGSITEEFQEYARRLGRTIELRPYVVPEAMQALQSGDAATHDALLARAAEQARACDVICFAQFSMTSAARRCAESSQRPVLTTPDSAVTKLKRLVLAL